MPYKILKRGKGYVVKNMKTGQEYSNNPISEQNAKAQLRLLQMLERKKK